MFEAGLERGENVTLIYELSAAEWRSTLIIIGVMLLITIIVVWIYQKKFK